MGQAKQNNVLPAKRERPYFSCSGRKSNTPLLHTPILSYIIARLPSADGQFLCKSEYSYINIDNL